VDMKGGIVEPSITILEEDGRIGVFELAPLERGYGVTIGNALRRVLLSSIEGYAIYGVIIEGVSHMFTTIKGVVQDVLDIVQNLKKVRFKPVAPNIGEHFHYKVKVFNETVFRAGDIKCAEFQIVNPDLVICEMEPSVSLDMDIYVKKGRGFLAAEENRPSDVRHGFIPIDSIFSPVIRVNYKVENVLHRGRTDYEKLILEVECDGSISPRNALSDAASILISHFQIVEGVTQLKETKVLSRVSGTSDGTRTKEIQGVNSRREDNPGVPDEVLNTPVMELDLPTRTLNALTAANIKTIGDLIKFSKEEIRSIRNIGNKGMEEIEKALKSFNVQLRDE